MTGIQLYSQALAIVADLESPEGADPDALAPALAAWFDASEDKMEAYIAVLRRMDNQEIELKAEQDAYGVSRKQLATQREHVRELAKLVLQAREELGEEGKLARPTWSARLQDFDSVCVPADLSVLPEDFIRWTSAADKPAIKAALKAGEDVAGCALLTSRLLVVVQKGLK
jgi:hypothetical protein